MKYCLHHPQRMRAANELDDSERPTIIKIVDEDEHQEVCRLISSHDTSIPPWIIKDATAILGSVDLFKDLTEGMLQVIDLPKTSHKALIIRLDEIPRFQQPPPFKKQTAFTWALTHGTTIERAQGILREGFIRPANWTYHLDLAKSELPTFGAYYLGRLMSNSLVYLDWAKVELLSAANLKGRDNKRS